MLLKIRGIVILILITLIVRDVEAEWTSVDMTRKETSLLGRATGNAHLVLLRFLKKIFDSKKRDEGQSLIAQSKNVDLYRQSLGHTKTPHDQYGWS